MHGAFDTSPHRFVAQIFVLAYSFFITISIGGGIMGESYIKQLLDEVERDIKTEVCDICRSGRLRQIIQTRGFDNS